jgi:hypothetical protein
MNSMAEKVLDIALPAGGASSIQPAPIKDKKVYPPRIPANLTEHPNFPSLEHLPFDDQCRLAKRYWKNLKRKRKRQESSHNTTTPPLHLNNAKRQQRETAVERQDDSIAFKVKKNAKSNVKSRTQLDWL